MPSARARRHLAVLHRSARSFSLMPDRVKRRVLAQPITLQGEDPVVPVHQPLRARTPIVSCALWPVLPLVTRREEPPLQRCSHGPPARACVERLPVWNPESPSTVSLAGLSGRDITEDQIACERVKNPLAARAAVSSRSLLSPLPALGITPHQPSEEHPEIEGAAHFANCRPSGSDTSVAGGTTSHRARPEVFHSPFMSSLAMAPNSSSSSSSEEDSRLLAASRVGPARPTSAKKQKSTTKQKKPGKTRALSTERSRQCRERQKLYSENLEAVVRALRTEVCDLEILRNLRREQSLQLRGSVSGSLAKIVREYMTVFRHGMPAPTVETATAGKKRALAAVYQPTPDAQREFLTCIMDPYVEVFDWCGRFVLGASTLLNGWTAWAAWHDSLDFELVDIDVVDTEETLAVTTKANLRVRVSQKTIEHLFPHIAGDQQLCSRMLGQEICYPMRDTFFFASNKRVIKYVCDIDFADALLPVAGDYETVLYLMSPPNQASLNDLAVRTSPTDLAERSRFDVEFLLSENDGEYQGESGAYR